MCKMQENLQQNALYLPQERLWKMTCFFYDMDAVNIKVKVALYWQYNLRSFVKAAECSVKKRKKFLVLQK